MKLQQLIKVALSSLLVGCVWMQGANASTCDVYYEGKSSHVTDCTVDMEGMAVVYTRQGSKNLIGDIEALEFTAVNNSSLQEEFKAWALSSEGTRHSIGIAVRGIDAGCFGGADFWICKDNEKAKGVLTDPKVLNKLSVFLTNFTENYMVDFEAGQLSPEEEIFFALRHDYINNYKSRIKEHVPSETCPNGEYMVSVSHILRNINIYLAKHYDADELKTPSDFCFDGENFHFTGSDGEAGYYAKVIRAVELPNGQILLSGWLYNQDHPEYRLGGFQAGAIRSKGHGGHHNLLIKYIKPYLRKDSNSFN